MYTVIPTEQFEKDVKYYILIFNTVGEIIDTIDIISGDDIRVGQSIIRNRKDRIGKRQYRQRVENLYNSREFRRYGKMLERDRAIKDIIVLFIVKQCQLLMPAD